MTEPFAYHDGATALCGLLLKPEGRPRGGVVIYPTIVNSSPNVVRKAHALAEIGFVVLIADFYGRSVDSFETAGPLAATLRADVEVYRARCRAALAALRGEIGDLPMAAVGFCMGGQAALEMVREGAEIVLAASFHGILTTAKPAQAPARARVLVCHGDADPLAPREHVLRLWEELDAAGADWHFHAYAGVRHGFTDPASDARGLPAIAYDASADRQSWAALTALLDELIPA